MTDPIKYGLSFINQLQPVSWQRKDNFDDKTYHSFIYQEVKPLIGSDKNGQTNTGTASIFYTDYIASLVLAVKELTTMVKTLKDEVTSLKAQINK